MTEIYRQGTKTSAEECPSIFIRTRHRPQSACTPFRTTAATTASSASTPTPASLTTIRTCTRSKTLDSSVQLMVQIILDILRQTGRLITLSEMLRKREVVLLYSRRGCRTVETVRTRIAQSSMLAPLQRQI